MGKTNKGSKLPGFEYNGRKPYSRTSPGSDTKKVSSRIDRARSKVIVQEEMKNLGSEYSNCENGYYTLVAIEEEDQASEELRILNKFERLAQYLKKVKARVAASGLKLRQHPISN